MYYDGGNIELDGAIYCGWFVAMWLPPEETAPESFSRWIDHALRLMGLGFLYMDNQ